MYSISGRRQIVWRSFFAWIACGWPSRQKWTKSCDHVNSREPSGESGTASRSSKNQRRWSVKSKTRSRRRWVGERDFGENDLEQTEDNRESVKAMAKQKLGSKRRAVNIFRTSLGFLQSSHDSHIYTHTVSKMSQTSLSYDAAVSNLCFVFSSTSCSFILEFLFFFDFWNAHSAGFKI